MATVDPGIGRSEAQAETQTHRTTADDGPATSVASAVPATLFPTDTWAGADPDLPWHVTANGHLIGDHTNRHALLPLMADEGLRHTVGRAEEVMLRTTDVDPRPWFRCPHGAGGGDSPVLHVLQRLGYLRVPWDVSSNDRVDHRGIAEVHKAPARCFTVGPTRLPLRYRSSSPACERQACVS
jgi:Polysaccharide deacetylase